MTNREPGRLGDLLDQALTEYVAGEPRPDLERRVLDYARRHAASHTAVRSRPLILWLSAVAVMLCAISIFRLENPSRQSRPEFQNQEVSSIQRAIPKAASRLPVRVAPVAVRERHTRRVNRVLPKRELFPAPSPLSAEERALLAYAKDPPKELPSELTELGAPIKPVQIAPIEIRPLDQITP